MNYLLQIMPSKLMLLKKIILIFQCDEPIKNQGMLARNVFTLYNSCKCFIKSAHGSVKNIYLLEIAFQYFVSATLVEKKYTNSLRAPDLFFFN